MHATRLKRPDGVIALRTHAVELHTTTSRLPLRPARCCCGLNGYFRDASPTRARRHGRRGRFVGVARQYLNITLALASGGGPRQSATSTAPSPQQRATPRPASGGGGGNDPEDESERSGDSFQIGLDPFSQQLIASALMAVGAWAIATWAHVDLSASLRPEGEALAVALQLSAPVLVLLLAVVARRWAPPFKGSELARLKHNYYMTAQVLQLYLDLDDEDEDGSSSGSSSWDDDGGGGGSGGERARVRRRLRLEQTVGWGTISSGLALMQAYTLQPWNPPTPTSVFGLALAGRSTQQLANEFLVRGAGWGLLSGWVAGELQSAEASDGILFFGKVFGGPEAVKYAAGLALVALALPGALWEARAARNFVRASVVGPVRDAAIFCTGNGVDEPAYCDPAGFAMLAARRPANAAPVADVVTRTRGWRSGPQASFSSDSSVSGVDVADLPPAEEEAVPSSAVAATAVAATAEAEAQQVRRDSAATAASAGTAARSRSSSPTSTPPPNPASSSPVAAGAHPESESEPGSESESATPSPSLPSAPSTPSPSPSGASPSAPPSHSPPSHSPSSSSSSEWHELSAPPPAAYSSSNGSGSGSGSSSSSKNGSGDGNGIGEGCSSNNGASPSPSSPSPSSSSPSPSSSSSSPPPPSPPLPHVGPTLAASSAAFEWDSEDMSVLLRVETLQDKIAFWSSLYYQLLAAFAINGAFLASDCNLLASFAAAWLLRTGPLMLSELRARAAADAADAAAAAAAAER